MIILPWLALIATGEVYLGMCIILRMTNSDKVTLLALYWCLMLSYILLLPVSHCQHCLDWRAIMMSNGTVFALILHDKSLLSKAHRAHRAVVRAIESIKRTPRLNGFLSRAPERGMLSRLAMDANRVTHQTIFSVVFFFL